jgi:aerobic-type carbon monoxide dehydrogenase small subunit (CoxS/CutS family)
MEKVEITFSLNGEQVSGFAEPRILLADFIRHELGWTGLHVGCEQGACGACTILVNNIPVRSCLMFAIQAEGLTVTTVEGLASSTELLHPLQSAFQEAHGLQCGFCTPGILMTMIPFLEENTNPTEADVRLALSGNICRCTGYQHIVDAVLLAAKNKRETAK